jgi:hypothetical protein
LNLTFARASRRANTFDAANVASDTLCVRSRRRARAIDGARDVRGV